MYVYAVDKFNKWIKTWLSVQYFVGKRRTWLYEWRWNVIDRRCSPDIETISSNTSLGEGGYSIRKNSLLCLCLKLMCMWKCLKNNNESNLWKIRITYKLTVDSRQYFRRLYWCSTCRIPDLFRRGLDSAAWNCSSVRCIGPAAGNGN